MSVTQTSMEAYFNNVKPNLNNKQFLVMEALEEIFPANNKELAKHLNWAINSVTPRVLELRKKKQVVIAYVARDESGRSSTYWKPATAEREAGDSF